MDRHLIEAAAGAASFTREVSRPDLLLISALLHDIGKGYPGDHSTMGAVVARDIGTRMGLPPRTWTSWRPWSGIICCFPRPPPGATWTTR
ncbi:HD domain-containing protein [Streptosporangium lutulentum]